MMKTAEELERELVGTKNEIEINKDELRTIRERIQRRVSEIKEFQKLNGKDADEIVRTQVKIKKFKDKLPKLKEQLAKAKKREKAEGKKAPKPAPAVTNATDEEE